MKRILFALFLVAMLLPLAGSSQNSPVLGSLYHVFRGQANDTVDRWPDGVQTVGDLLGGSSIKSYTVCFWNQEVANSLYVAFGTNADATEVCTAHTGCKTIQIGPGQTPCIDTIQTYFTTDTAAGLTANFQATILARGGM